MAEPHATRSDDIDRVERGGSGEHVRSGAMRVTSLLALMLAVFTVSLGYGIVVPLLPYLIERLLGTGMVAERVARDTGFLTAAYAVALFLFAPGWGRLSDRRGRRAVLLYGLVGFAVTMLVFSFVESRPAVYAQRFLSGMFASAVTPVASAVVTDLAPTPQRRGRWLAYVSAAGIGGVLLGPTVGVFFDRFGNLVWRDSAQPGSLAVPLAATALLALLAAAIVAVAIRDVEPGHAEPAMPVVREGERRIIPVMLLLGFVVSSAIGSFHVGLALRGREQLALSPYQVALMFTECSVVMLAAQAFIFSPLIKVDATRWFIPPALATLAAGLFLVPRAPGYTSMLLVVGAIGTSAGVVSPILTYWISASAGAARGAELGRQTAASSLGQTVGAAAGGLLFGVTALQNLSFIVTGALVVLGVLVSVRVPRRLGSEVASETAAAVRS